MDAAQHLDRSLLFLIFISVSSLLGFRWVSGEHTRSFTITLSYASKTRIVRPSSWLAGCRDLLTLDRVQRGLCRENPSS